MQAKPFLMFQGQAKDALALWQSVIPDFEVISVKEFETGDQAGQIEMAFLKIGGTTWQINDSPPVHDFTFTPSSSIFVECDDEGQLRAIAANLEEGGKFLMPVGDYGFSKLFAWVSDPFGVSWQLNLSGE